MEPRQASRWWGLMALGCYAAHAAVTASRDPAQNLLWGCHLAALLVAIGWLARSPRLNGVGTLWLAYGTPMWIVGLLSGVELVVTSPLLHGGGTLIGLWGVRRMGLPAGTWWRAGLATAGLMLVTRVVAPPEDNVNLAFAIQAGWEGTFTSYPLYALLMVGGAAAVYGVVELGLRRLWPCDPPPSAEDPAGGSSK